MQQSPVDDDVPDEALMRQSLQNPECFAVIFDRHARTIYGYLSRRVGPAADDLLSETFLTAFRSRSAYSPDRAPVRPWLFGIATNLLKHHARTEQRRYRALSRLPPDGAPEVLVADNAATRVDAQALRGELSKVLAALTAGDRDVLLMAAWADLSYSEIAAALNIPVGTVRSRLNPARRITRFFHRPCVAERPGDLIMNELTLLRDFGPETAEPTDEVLADSRALLVKELTRADSSGGHHIAPAPRLSTNPAKLRTRRRWRRPVLIAACVAALVAAGLIIPTLPFVGRPVNSAVAAEFIRAADAADRIARAGGDATPSGKYRYIETDSWNASAQGAVDSPGGTFTYLRQERRQIWVPANWQDNWLTRNSTTAQRKWIVGSEKQAAAAGDPAEARTDPAVTGPCGFQSTGTNLCTAQGSWQMPTQPWIAGLPTTADAMYDKLDNDSAGMGQSHESEMLVQATDALQTGLLPLHVAAILYRAMAQIGGVKVTATAINLDGEVGTGFTVDGPFIQQETIIDPTSGEFIGTRSTSLQEDPGLKIPAGTVMSYTAVHITIAGRLGAEH